MEGLVEIPVSDPEGAIHDSKMVWLKQALDPQVVQRTFERRLHSTLWGKDQIRLHAIRVQRYKPERRCLIEYDLAVHNDTGWEMATIMGKVRAKGLDYRNYQIQRSLWQNGFNEASPDRILVAEPVGVISEFQMWLQRKMPGCTATELLGSKDGLFLMRRIAEAAFKLHRVEAATLSLDRLHSISDEMNILSDRLARVILLRPGWKKRLQRLLEGCSLLAASLPDPKPCGIHRDFYPDQVLVDGDRLVLLDLDLFCLGDPALDIGNFIGHITEHSLRKLGDPTALKGHEQLLEDHFVELAGEEIRERVRVYTLLSLARHIYLSTQFPERLSYTETILEMCEQRLGTMISG